MAKKRAFISFDFENDEELRTLLANQANFDDSPFEFANWSVKAHLPGDWEAKVRTRIRSTDLTIVICGQYTDRAEGVSIELDITREENKPYFLLWGRSEEKCTKPKSAYESDKIYEWTWPNLKSLIGGAR